MTCWVAFHWKIFFLYLTYLTSPATIAWENDRMLPSLRSVVRCLFPPMALQAQVSMTLTIRNPMPPELSTRESDRTVAPVLLLNAGPALNNARIGMTIHEAASGALVASTRDNNPAMPRFNLPTAGTAVSASRLRRKSAEGHITTTAAR